MSNRIKDLILNIIIFVYILNFHYIYILYLFFKYIYIYLKKIKYSGNPLKVFKIK